MEDVLSRLKALKPTINEICRVSGCPGASIGVLYKGKVLYTEGFGLRDVKKRLVPDENTIYYLASMSKAFTAAMVGILVEQKKLEWSTPVSKILQRLHHFDRDIQERSTMVDWLSHRTGLAPKNSIWSVECGHSALKRRDAIPTINYLEKVFDFRTRWLYSNWGYALADEVIQKLSGESWGTALKTNIFDPLGMSRTITTHNTSLPNVAEAYMPLSDGTPYHLPRPFPEDGKVMEGAVAVQSNVKDLLSFYKMLMVASEDQLKNGTTATPDCPLNQLPMLVHSHVALSPDKEEKEKGYGLGWIRTELPGSLGVIGINPAYIQEMPVVGKGLDEKTLCLYHQGSSNGFLNSVHLLPETQTAIVVLTNAMADNDTADWLGELVLESVLDNPDKNDYVALAKSSAKTSLELWSKMKETLEEQRTPGTKARSANAYVGKYYNVIGKYYLEVLEKDDRLMMCFQGNHDQLYNLEHYHFDTFSWLISKDEDVRRGRIPTMRASFYLLEFKAKTDATGVDQLIWVDDGYIPEGETFRKDWAPDAHKANAAIEGPV